MTISNDGATIMKLLDIVHPAAKVLADISMSQDAEVRFSSTSVYGSGKSECIVETQFCQHSRRPMSGAYSFMMTGGGWDNNSGHPSRGAFKRVQSICRGRRTSEGAQRSPAAQSQNPFAELLRRSKR